MGWPPCWGYQSGKNAVWGLDTPNHTPTFWWFLAVVYGTNRAISGRVIAGGLDLKPVMTRVSGVCCVPVKAGKSGGKITEI